MATPAKHRVTHWQPCPQWLWGFQTFRLRQATGSAECRKVVPRGDSLSLVIPESQWKIYHATARKDQAEKLE